MHPPHPPPQSRRRRLLGLALGLGATHGLKRMAWAQDRPYPTHPITLVVPFPPGGPADANGRLIGRLLGAALGQPVVIDNKPGASGSIGAEAVARAPADGYTLLAGTMGTHALNPVMQSAIRYDPLKDFVPLHTTVASVNVLVVAGDRPYRTLAEFIAYAKANPGKVNYGLAGGPGTGNALAGDLFQRAAGLRLTPIAYKGNAPALNDLLAGTIDAMFSYPAETVAHVRSGKIRALAVSHTQRIELMPDVPTMDEAGVRNAELVTWGGLFAPTGTPPAVTARLVAELDRIMRNPDVVRSMTEQGVLPYAVGGDAFAALVRNDVQRWAHMLKEDGSLKK